jgi:hypothetical protein
VAVALHQAHESRVDQDFFAIADPPLVIVFHA